MARDNWQLLRVLAEASAGKLRLKRKYSPLFKLGGRKTEHKMRH